MNVRLSRAAILAGRAVVVLLLVICELSFFGVAQVRADGGEVGLVIQNGDVVETYCIPFTGDGLTGDQLLQKAGVSVVTGGAQSGRTVCALNQVGCFNVNPNDFNSCFCQCTGGSSCTYWAYFTKPYGKSWAYSSLALNLVKAKDGDLQGWKWGAGGPASAPAPVDITFEQVCRHAPAGGAAQPTVAPPTAANSPPPPTAITATTLAPSTAATAASIPPASAPAAPTAVLSTPPPTIPENITVIPRTPGETPAAPAVGEAGDSGGDDGQLLAFAVVVAGLGAAIAIAVLRRRRIGR